MSTAACAPILGRLGDIIGRRTTLFAGELVFALGNVLSALAPSLGFMLLARFVVGIGSAAMTPVIIAYIVAEFPPERVARGFSLYMLLSSASVIAGPTLGGLMVAAYGWRAMVWVCALISGAVLLLGLLCRGQETQTRGSLRGFDGKGAALVVVFFSLVLCLPSFAQNFGWTSAAFRAVLVAAAIGLALLIFVERRAAQPILPAAFLKRRALLLSVLTLFLTQGLMQANMTNTIVFVNYTRPESSAVSGYAISAMYLGMSLGAALLGPLAARRSAKNVLTVSLLITLAGCGLLLCFSGATPTYLLMSSLALLGFGLGANGTILLKVALAGLPPQEAGAGTGVYGLFRDLAAPFGVAVFVPLYTNRASLLLAEGFAAAEAAVQALHTLAFAELACIILGIVTVRALPNTQERRT